MPCLGNGTRWSYQYKSKPALSHDQIVRTTLEQLVLAVKGENVMTPELDKVNHGCPGYFCPFICP